MKPVAEIRKIKSTKEDELLSRPGVTGVDIGPKIVKGNKTDEIAIRVYVEKKKDVPAKEKIPATIDGVKTDVIERRFVLHQRAVPVSEVTPKADTTLYDPLVGGISIGPCKAVDGYIYVGTLGCFVKDRDNGEILILSNYHVLAEKWSNGDTLCQPSRVDGGSCPSNTIGSLLRSTLSDRVDGAVARLNNRSHRCEIAEIGAVRGKATASVEMAVRKRGRTTGLTYGVVDTIDLTVNVRYDDGVRTLRNQIGIAVDTAQSTQIGNSGDSGSVVVEENNRVVGLYFAGSEDGSYGVANPIDHVLDELNIDLCVEGEKTIQLEKSPVEKVWMKEHFKEILKEYAYEKPPLLENKFFEGPPWGYPPFGGGAPTQGPATAGSIEQRLARLEALLAGKGSGTGPVAPHGMECIRFTEEPVASHPNPLSRGSATFTVFDYTDAPVPAVRIDQWGGIQGLNAGYRTRITTPPCRRVKLIVVHFNPAGATAYGFDANGQQVAVASTTPAQGVEQTLLLSSSGDPIIRVELKCPQNEVLIRQFCHCTGFKKTEKPEFKEFKDLKEKPEPKELKEKPEPKELKEAKEKPEHKEFKDLKEKPEPKELKEKPEPKELKETKEKPEHKEFKDLKEKPEPKELKEKPEPKELFEQKPFEGGHQPLSPLPQGQAAGTGSGSVEERLARLEALLGGDPHFIGQELRPDLSGGALQNEPDLGRKR